MPPDETGAGEGLPGEEDASDTPEGIVNQITDLLDQLKIKMGIGGEEAGGEMPPPEEEPLPGGEGEEGGAEEEPPPPVESRRRPVPAKKPVAKK